MKQKNTGKKQNIFSRNSACFMSAAIAAVITMFAYAVWEFFPFGENIILRMDLYHQYAPLYAELLERIFGGDSLIYSFTSGLGSSFVGNYFNYLSSPTLLFVLAFGHYNVPEAIAAIVLFKASASAFTFTYFLGKISKKNDVTTAAFGLLYAFCGYFIAYYWNIMWMDAVVAFPLVMLGIWYIIKKGKPTVYVCSLAYIMMTNYYMAYMTCILSVIFFLYFYFSEHSLGETIHNNVIIREKYKKTLGVKLFNSKFLTSGFTFAGASVLSAMLAAFALLPVFFILQNSSATNSTFPSSFSSYFSIFDYFANHFAGVTPTIRSSGDAVYPNVYCGVITMILVPLYMFSKRFSVKEKIATASVLALFFCSFNINILNYIWHGFHFPNDLPYRFSFAYSFFLLFVAYKVITNIKYIKGKEILLSACGVAAFAVLVEKTGSANVSQTVVWTTIVFSVVYAAVLVFMKNPKYAKSAISVLLLTAICAEILIADTPNYKVTQTKDSYTSSYDATSQAIGKVNELEGDDGFYRMELATLLTRMDNSWFYYNGVSTFTSMAYEKVANLQYCLGLFGNEINSYTYNCQTGLYNSMMSLKYVLDNASLVPTDSYKPVMDGNWLYTKVDTVTAEDDKEVTIYKNNYWLPVAFSVNENTDSKWVFNNGAENRDDNNPFVSQNDFYYNATGIADILERIDGAVSDKRNIEDIDETAVNNGLFNVYKQNTSEKTNEVTFKYVIEETQNVYVYVASRGIDSVLVNAGGFTYNQSLSNNAYILDIGTVEAGTDLYISYSLKDDQISANINQFVYGLNKDKFVEAYNTILKNGTLDVTENTESYIKGTINLADGKMLYTSIPYDKGWSVYVDGVKLSDENIVTMGDALMGVYMESGEHTVEFKYTPRGLVLGIGLSVLAFLIFILLFIFKKKSIVFFSPAFKANVLELGKWRDAEAEAEISLIENELCELVSEASAQTDSGDEQWAQALAEAQALAKADSADEEAPVAEAEMPTEEELASQECECTEESDVPPVAEEEPEEPEYEEAPEKESIDDIISQFEQSTASMGEIRKPRISADDKKSARKKRVNLTAFIVIIAVAVVAAVAIMVYSATGDKEPETNVPEVTGDIAEELTAEEEESSEERTTVTTSAPETTTEEPETTTKAPVTTTKAPVTTTKAPATTTKKQETTTKEPVTEYTGKYVEYTLKYGDTYYSILREHGINPTPAKVEKFCAINGITPNTILNPGVVLKVPTEF